MSDGQFPERRTSPSGPAGFGYSAWIWQTAPPAPRQPDSGRRASASATVPRCHRARPQILHRSWCEALPAPPVPPPAACAAFRSPESPGPVPAQNPSRTGRTAFSPAPPWRRDFPALPPGRGSPPPDGWERDPALPPGSQWPCSTPPPEYRWAGRAAPGTPPSAPWPSAGPPGKRFPGPAPPGAETKTPGGTVPGPSPSDSPPGPFPCRNTGYRTAGPESALRRQQTLPPRTGSSSPAAPPPGPPRRPLPLPLAGFCPGWQGCPAEQNSRSWRRQWRFPARRPGAPWKTASGGPYEKGYIHRQSRQFSSYCLPGQIFSS